MFANGIPYANAASHDLKHVRRQHNDRWPKAASLQRSAFRWALGALFLGQSTEADAVAGRSEHRADGRSIWPDRGSGGSDLPTE